MTWLGGAAGIGIATAALLAFFLWRKQYMNAATLMMTLVGIVGIEVVLKQLFQVARPEVFPHLAHATGYSFPSGHAVRAVGLYGFVAALLVSYGPGSNVEVARGRPVRATGGGGLCQSGVSRCPLADRRDRRRDAGRMGRGLLRGPALHPETAEVSGRLRLRSLGRAGGPRREGDRPGRTGQARAGRRLLVADRREIGGTAARRGLAAQGGGRVGVCLGQLGVQLDTARQPGVIRDLPVEVCGVSRWRGRRHGLQFRRILTEDLGELGSKRDDFLAHRDGPVHVGAQVRVFRVAQAMLDRARNHTGRTWRRWSSRRP